MISRFLPGLSQLYARLASANDDFCTLALLSLGCVIILAAILLPSQLKPLAIAYIIFP